MSTEPEREIEKELKAYAQRRREQAGAPVEMHAATRKLLQGEVARTHSAAGKASASAGSFWNWRRQWAFGLAAACALVAVLVLVPLASNRKGRGERSLQLAKNDDVRSFKANKAEKQKSESLDTPSASGPPSSLATPAPMESEKVPAPAPTPAAREPALQLAAKDAATNLQTYNSGLSRSRVENAPAMSVASPAPAPVVTDGFAQAGNSPIVTREVTNALSAAVPAAADRASLDKSWVAGRASQIITDTNSAAAVVVQQFAADELAKGQLGLLEKASASPVLKSFRVEQSGAELRIIDGDGSVYSGFVETREGAGGRVGGLADQSRALSGEVDQAKKIAPVARSAAAPARRDLSADFKQTTNVIFFRVNGTNRTLGKPVVFSGDLLSASFAPATNLAAFGAPSGAGGGAAPATGQTLPAPLPDARLRGRVIIDGTNQVEINAHSLKRAP